MPVQLQNQALTYTYKIIWELLGRWGSEVFSYPLSPLLTCIIHSCTLIYTTSDLALSVYSSVLCFVFHLMVHTIYIFCLYRGWTATALSS
jgi:hypothetical protein